MIMQTIEEFFKIKIIIFRYFLSRHKKIKDVILIIFVGSSQICHLPIYRCPFILREILRYFTQHEAGTYECFMYLFTLSINNKLLQGEGPYIMGHIINCLE